MDDVVIVLYVDVLHPYSSTFCHRPSIPFRPAKFQFVGASARHKFDGAGKLPPQ